jgi:hypothetical protein
MSLAKVARTAALALTAAALAAPAAAGEGGAVVEVENLVLRADGGFTPHSLPRHRFVPIDFQGHVDISAKGGGKPAALQRALIDFDRDGRLSVAGLPSCAPEAIADATPAQARRICRGAIVGSGHVEAAVSLPGGSVRARSPLTIFNGPRLATGPSAILHARTTVPSPQTYAIVVPIERRRGYFRYRARLEVPPLAGGLGSLTHIDVKIGRRYRVDGQDRSYVSARCSDNILQTRGRFAFEGGIEISGLVEKFCEDE